jgi:putative transposase
MKDPRNRTFYLPRLERVAYQGFAAVHWTLPIANRATGWLTETFHAHFRELMLHAAAREGLLCPTYCLMPDHLHLLWLGIRTDTDQRNAMTFFRTHLEPALGEAKFQHQAHDHVLREEERRWDASAETCGYIIANPVRAGLVAEAREWAYIGAVVPGYPRLDPREVEFWGKFERIQAAVMRRESGGEK